MKYCRSSVRPSTPPSPDTPRSRISPALPSYWGRVGSATRISHRFQEAPLWRLHAPPWRIQSLPWLACSVPSGRYPRHRACGNTGVGQLAGMVLRSRFVSSHSGLLPCRQEDLSMLPPKEGHRRPAVCCKEPNGPRSFLEPLDPAHRDHQRSEQGYGSHRARPPIPKAARYHSLHRCVSMEFHRRPRRPEI